MSQIQEISPRIVLLACGCFSPPTLMHLRMFEIARDHIEITKTGRVIGGIISPTHDSYGKNGLAPAKHRLAMLKLSLQTSNWIKVSDWECNQNQWSRTRQTLQYHQNYMNNIFNEGNNLNQNLPGWLPDNIRNNSGVCNDRVKLKLLCGADLLESFAVPGLWSESDIEEIVGNFGIVVISRSGANPEKFIFDSDILTKYQTNITIVRNWVPNEVSSSMIRRLLKRGQSVKYLIDDLVLTYIQKNGLYDIQIPEYLFDYQKKFIITNRNYIIENYLNEIDLKTRNSNIKLQLQPQQNDQQQEEISQRSQQQIEYMDETDYLLSNKLSPNNNSNNDYNINILNRSNVFCCKGTDNTNNSDSKFTLNCPGQAVKIITNPLQHLHDRKDQQQRISDLNKANAKKVKINHKEDNNDQKLTLCDEKAVNFI